MFYPLSFYIGLRYTRAKRRTHFISFISLASMIGIALGIMVLITVLSVMNGFDEQIKNRIFAMVPQLTITNFNNVDAWQKLEKEISTEKGVVAAAPFATTQAMISNSGNVTGIYLTGILPDKEAYVSAIHTKMLSGKMTALRADDFGIVLGADLAAKLGVTIGDKVTIITPQTNSTPIGIVPRYKRFHVVGIFQVGGGFGFDSNAAFIHLNDAQKLLQLGDSVTGLRVKVTDLYAAPLLTAKLNKTFSRDYLISDWTQDYGALFKAIQMEKTMMFVILLFIIAVAAFNLVSTLVMAVNDKQAEIAILRTLGATPKTIMAIFMVQGSIIGFIGTIIGILGGIVLAINAPTLVALIEHYFHVQFISSAIYLIDALPSKLEWLDILHIGGVAFLMSVLATLYPAWNAARTKPAEALRYE
jgi:lipoprotein-releasing system permease protein